MIVTESPAPIRPYSIAVALGLILWEAIEAKFYGTFLPLIPDSASRTLLENYFGTFKPIAKKPNRPVGGYFDGVQFRTTSIFSPVVIFLVSDP